jgi:hypothetical protein
MSAEETRQSLDIDTIKELWSKTYNREGKPDWSHIFKYYHQDIVFQDTIQRIDGIDDFITMCNRLEYSLSLAETSPYSPDRGAGYS